MENTVKQAKNKFDWLKEYQWQKGQSGNPNGRPKTKTLKEYARDFLANMSEEARIEYLSSLEPSEVWKMAEGSPKQDTDMTTGGEKIKFVITNYGENDSYSSPVQPEAVSIETDESKSAFQDSGIPQTGGQK